MWTIALLVINSMNVTAVCPLTGVQPPPGVVVGPVRIVRRGLFLFHQKRPWHLESGSGIENFYQHQTHVMYSYECVTALLNTL